MESIWANCFTRGYSTKLNRIWFWNVTNPKREMREAFIRIHQSLQQLLDYVLIALGKNGRVIVGDAPVQECNFERLIPPKVDIVI